MGKRRSTSLFAWGSVWQNKEITVEKDYRFYLDKSGLD